MSYSFSLKDSILELGTYHRYYSASLETDEANVDFKINCDTHKYSANIKAPKRDIPFIREDIPNLFFFYIYAHCPNCSSLDTADFEIKDGKFVQAKIERETFRAKEDKISYHVELLYNENKMLISLMKPEGISKPIKLPIYDLDLSNPDDLAAQIKNIIAFS